MPNPTENGRLFLPRFSLKIYVLFVFYLWLNHGMNQTQPGKQAPIAGVITLPAFKNRSTGLTVFGILTILLGCAAALMVLLMLVATALVPKSPNAPPVSSTVMVVFMYGALAVALVWLGIGSIMARRWARALILIFSWGWLVAGIIMVPLMGIVMPKTFRNMPVTPGQPAMPPGAIAGMTIFILLFLSVFFVVIPAIWVFFYGNHHTRATVEMRDPIRRWTDACPLPVLALCLWLLISVPIMLLLPVAYHGVVPFFGMFLNGLPGSLFCVAIAALWAYCGWRLYKMDVRGWWLVLIIMSLYMVSTVMTFMRHDMVEMYQLMGYSQAQIDQVQQVGIFTGNNMAWLMLFFFVPFLGYLAYVKKYLPAKA